MTMANSTGIPELSPAILARFSDIINDQAVSDVAFVLLTLCYSLMILGSVMGNVLVITAVLRSAHMRKANNVLIVNLAMSDLLLCSIVSPATLVEILFKRWQWPHIQKLCQLSGMGPVAITFVSTLTITGIAIDRYKVIVYSATSARAPPKLSHVLLTVASIWMLAVLLASPLLMAMSLDVIPMPVHVASVIRESTVAYCAENWGIYSKGRLFYSLFIFVVQFILPITLISLAHHAIQRRLRKLPSWQNKKGCKKANLALNKGTRAAGPSIKIDGDHRSSNDHHEQQQQQQQQQQLKTTRTKRMSLPMVSGISMCKDIRGRRVDDNNEEEQGDEANNKMEAMLRLQNTRLQEKIKKQSRTHALLVSIVVVFALSWLPLNALNIVLDLTTPFQNEELSRVCFALCHLIGMSSAFSNPILYGWFNDAFHNEFQAIAKSICPWWSRVWGRRSDSINNNNNPGNNHRLRREHNEDDAKREAEAGRNEFNPKERTKSLVESKTCEGVGVINSRRKRQLRALRSSREQMCLAEHVDEQNSQLLENEEDHEDHVSAL